MAAHISKEITFRNEPCTVMFDIKQFSTTEKSYLRYLKSVKNKLFGCVVSDRALLWAYSVVALCVLGRIIIRIIVIKAVLVSRNITAL